jgi:hypothetical protein|tara:strand:+ start:13 stop:186 length:174 start_codon:yes stop_codon:yes gene_type:complete
MPLQNKHQQGFILAMARELLVHNPEVKTVEQAMVLATDLITQSHTHSENSDDTVAKR